MPCAQPNIAAPRARFMNMDLVRYVLALAVVVAHFNLVFGSNYFWPLSSGTAVGAFFGLSGFLVYGSYLRRPSFWPYLKSRMRRIMPSYYFVVMGCALGLSLLSSLPASEYFTSGQFWKYLLSNACFMNFIEPDLPGVFQDNTMSCVNGSLWTLKVEWMLYLSVPLFFWLVKRFKWNIIYAVSAIFVLSVAYRVGMQHAYETTGREIFHTLSYQFGGQLVYFYSGVLYYHMLDTIKRHKVVCLLIGAALCLAYFSLAWLPESIATQSLGALLFPAGIVLICVVLSVCKSLGQWIAQLGNCSYEIYLFHFPILQAFFALGLAQHLPLPMVFSICIVTVFLISFAFNRLINTHK